MTRLVTHSVAYRAGTATILTPTSLALDPGELVAVVGPNGAGKTTLLRLLGGDLTPSSGEVTIGTTDVPSLPEAELALTRSMLAQDGPGDIPFSAAAIVGLGRHPHRRLAGNSAGHDAEVVEDAMRRVGIANLASRVFATLSGGERALVSLARVLAQDCPIVLLDEPTGSLDVAFEERVMSLIRQEAERGRIVIAVLHDLNLAARHAQRCLVLTEGTIVGDGPPAQVLTPELLTRVYRHPMQVVEHPLGGGPLILVE